jgi:hypothetical protein
VSISPANRISIEAARRRTQQAQAQFRGRLIATIVVLALACAGLGAASVLQGPRIEGSQLDLSAAVSAPSSLRIVLDERVAPLAEDGATVEPETPMTVQDDGDVVLVQFERPLEYDTTYTVTLAGVRAAAGGVTVDLRHEFHTPPFAPVWVQRSESGDRILTGALGAEPATLFTAARIQDFLPLGGDALLVVTLDDADASHASIVATDGSGNEEELLLPGGEPGRIESLELAGTNVLYTFTSLGSADEDSGIPAFDQTLFRLDLTGSHVSEPVAGVAGDPLSVDSIIPVRGTTAALVHTRAAEVLRYDPAGEEPPSLVGEFSEMVALAGDRHRLSVKDSFGPLIYDFDDGSEARINPSPDAATGVVPFIADVVPVRDGYRIERAVVPNEDYSAFESFIAIDDGTSSSVLYRTPEVAGSVVGYRMTANDRYLVAEVGPGGNSFDTSDGYAGQSRPRDVITVVIDIWAGTVVAEWPGSHARW